MVGGIGFIGTPIVFYPTAISVYDCLIESINLGLFLACPSAYEATPRIRSLDIVKVVTDEVDDTLNFSHNVLDRNAEHICEVSAKIKYLLLGCTLFKTPLGRGNNFGKQGHIRSFDIPTLIYGN